MKGKRGDLTGPLIAAAASATAQDSGLQAQLAAIIEATPDGVALIDPRGKLRYLNPAGRSLLGLQPDQPLSALSILDSFPPSLRLRLQQEALPAALEEGQWSAEAELLDGAGQAVPVSLAMFAHKEAHAKVSLLSVIVRDIREQKRRETELAYLAHHDALTGLFNRRRFQEELDRRLAHIRRYRTQGALLFIDVDNLKSINDTYGHQAGDTILQDLTALLRAQLREVDVIARLGGDEFAVLISTQDAQRALAVAERLVQAVRRHVSSVAGYQLQYTISIGIALIPQHGSASDEVLKHADLALYRSKLEGRNQSQLFASALSQ